MGKRTDRKKLIVALALLAFFAVNSYLLFFPVPISVGTVYVPPGSKSGEIALILKEKGIIRNRLLFRFLGEFYKLFKNIKAGEYSFGSRASTLDVVKKLASGDIKIHVVTVPEGYTMEEIALVLSMEGLVDFRKFIALANNANLTVDTFSFPAKLEGYLFPETYKFAKVPNAEEYIIMEMLREFKKRVVDVYSAEIEQKGYTLEKVLIMASLVEREALINPERPIITRVFYNRLKKGMMLQSCPTVMYALGKFRGKLSNEDLKVKSPFNTYICTGLPPGPICSPGVPSIEAAIRPADVNYLYFVSRNNGTHYFSRDYESHKRAKLKYQGT